MDAFQLPVPQAIYMPPNRILFGLLMRHRLFLSTALIFFRQEMSFHYTICAAITYGAREGTSREKKLSVRTRNHLVRTRYFFLAILLRVRGLRNNSFNVFHGFLRLVKVGPDLAYLMSARL